MSSGTGSHDTTNNRTLSIRELKEVDSFQFLNSAHKLYAPLTKPYSYVRIINAYSKPLSRLISKPFVVGGEKPSWCEQDQSIYFGDTNVFKTDNIYYLPKLGVIITSHGDVLQTTFEEARFYLGGINKLPFMINSLGEEVFNPPANIPEILEAYIFLPWGAIHNYGHFLIDALAGIVALDYISKKREWTLVAPPLNSWQKKLLEILLISRPNLKLKELTGEIYFVNSSFHPSTMDHFMHHPNQILRMIGDSITSNLELIDTNHDLVDEYKYLYITRGKNEKRKFCNERDLIRTLLERGFSVISPENMSIEKQIKIFSSCEIVIGASGAALANTLFMKKGTYVIEIQPLLAQNIWIRNICINLGLNWLPYFARSILGDSPVEIGGIERPEVGIEFLVEIPHIINQIDKVVVATQTDSQR